MQLLAYWIARLVIALLQSLPLKMVALIGRFGGALAWIFDKRHRLVMLDNLGKAFPEKSQAEIRAIARENMFRIGENYAAAVKTSVIPVDGVLKICEVTGSEKIGKFGT